MRKLAAWFNLHTMHESVAEALIRTSNELRVRAVPEPYAALLNRFAVEELKRDLDPLLRWQCAEAESEPERPAFIPRTARYVGQIHGVHIFEAA